MQWVLEQDFPELSPADATGYRVKFNANADRAFISSPYFGNGAVRVYQYVTNNWIQMGTTVVAVEQNFGISLDCNSTGSRFVVGMDQTVNKVRVFEYDGSSWVQVGADILGQSGESFGYDVAMNGSGSRVVVGGFSGSLGSGVVRIFEFDGAVWNQVGSDIDGIENGENFGVSVDINFLGNIIIAGANLNGTLGGEIRVYQYDGANWNQVGNSVTGAVLAEGFGNVVSINGIGDIIAAWGNTNANGRGVVRIYQNIANVWTQMGSDIVGTIDNESLGCSIDLNDTGLYMSIGAFGYDEGNSEGGATIYNYDGINWVEIAPFAIGTPGSQFGLSSSLNDAGDVMLVGAPFGSTGYAGVYRLQNFGEAEPEAEVELEVEPEAEPEFILNIISFDFKIISPSGNIFQLSTSKYNISDKEVQNHILLFLETIIRNYTEKDYSVSPLSLFRYFFYDPNTETIQDKLDLINYLKINVIENKTIKFITLVVNSIFNYFVNLFRNIYSLEENYEFLDDNQILKYEKRYRNRIFSFNIKF
jgi:hypothetical protein